MKAKETPEIQAPKLDTKVRAVSYFVIPSVPPEWTSFDREAHQRTQLARYAMEHNLSISAVLSDQHSQEQIGLRAGFMLALRHVEAGLANVLLVPSVADLSDTIDQVALVFRTIFELNARLIIIKEKIDTDTNLGRLIGLLTSGVRTLETDFLAEKVRRHAG